MLNEGACNVSTGPVTDTRKRNMDRRRETSRCAARDRRGKEADIFADLKEVVPLVEDVNLTHLDRIALLRVAATVCRLRKNATNVLECNLGPEQSPGPWNEDTITECLDGFVLIVDNDATVLYVTESVALYLGHSQTDMTGQNLRDFLHPDDFDEFMQLATQMGGAGRIDEVMNKSIVFRIKSIISPRGRNLNMRSALYKPVSFTVQARRATGGFMLILQGTTIPAGQGTINSTASALTKNSDVASGVYMTRHTCDMKISYITDRLNYILKNELKSLLGTSFYDLVHPYDCAIVNKSMKELFVKGHVRTPYYRLLAAAGSFAWVMTEATTITHTTKGQKGQYVVCIHFILGIQRESESLVVCTDASPAGLPVNIKKEIDDIGEFVGRQPAVIENENYVPLFADDAFNATESLRSPDGTIPAEVHGGRKNSYDEVLQWLFRDESSSPAQIHQQQGAGGDPTLASAQFNVAPTGAIKTAGTHTQNTQFAGRGASHAAGSAQLGGIWSAADSSPRISHGGYRSVANGQTTSPIPGIPAAFASHSNSVSPVGGIRSPGMFAAVSAAHSAQSAQAGSAHRGPIDPSAEPREQYQSQQQSAVVGEKRNAFTPIVEDLQWEEPDLTGLAPFIPDEDEIALNGDDGLPKDLQLLFSDLPDWSPAQPLVANPPNINKGNAKPSPSSLSTPYQSNGVYDCYRQPFMQPDTGLLQPIGLSAGEYQQPYWQPSMNWQQAANSR